MRAEAFLDRTGEYSFVGSDLATTFSEFAAQVKDAGPHHAPGLVPWLQRLRDLAAASTGETQEQCSRLAEALEFFILEDEDPQAAHSLLHNQLKEYLLVLGADSPTGVETAPPSRGALDLLGTSPVSIEQKVSSQLNEFAEQLEAAGPNFAPGLAPWLPIWKDFVEQTTGELQVLCSKLAEALTAWILTEQDHDDFFEALVGCLCDLRLSLDEASSTTATPSTDAPSLRADSTGQAPVASTADSMTPPRDYTAGTGTLKPSARIEHSTASVPVNVATPPRSEPEPAPTPATGTTDSETPEQAGGSATVAGEGLDLAAPDFMLEFAVEGNEQLAECSQHLLLLDKNPEDSDSLAAVFRCFHTIKGVAGFMGMDQLQSVAHAAEDLLDIARAGKLSLAGDPLDAIFDASDLLNTLINAIPESLKEKPWSAPESNSAPELVARIRTLLSNADVAPPPRRSDIPMARLHPEPEQGPPSGASPSSARTASSGQDSVRVDAERLDHLVDMIGELVINQSMLIRALEIGDDRETERQLSRMGKVTREVQSVGGSLRMVPVRACFSKMARLARDVAKKSKKRVEFTLSGEDTELDKTVVDRIADPLVHLVRNAIDHGLETDVNERLRLGKPEVGQVQLRAFHKGGNIHIEIEDDGRGMNRDRIIEVAIERGVIRDGETLSDKEAFRLVCEPGFSTRKEVTSLSGRGVGMDVVKRQIDSMGGTLDIQSTLGAGSCFSMRVPLTLAVIDGMVIGLGPTRFVIPTLNIVRLVEPEEAQTTRVFEDGELLLVANEPVPILRMEELFDLPPTQADKQLAVIAEASGVRMALLIDELLGQQQAVIKSLGHGLGNVQGVSGCAIMPDGRVGLVLDVAGLLDLAKQPLPQLDPNMLNRASPANSPPMEEQWMP